MNLTKFTILLMLLSLALPLSSAAENSRQQQLVKQKASQYFSRGELLFSSGDYSKAAEAFLLAYETYPHPSTLVNIGLCYERAGWLPKAVEIYKKYVSRAAGAPDEKAIRKKIKKLSKSLGEIDIICLSEEDECAIRVDGSDRGNAPLTVLVEPGQRSVAAFINGQEVFASTVPIDAGESRAIQIKPAAPDTNLSQPINPQTAPTPTESEMPPVSSDEGNTISEGEKRRVVMSPAFWSLTGTTVLSGAMTIVFGVRYFKAIERFEASDKTDLKASEDGRKSKIATNVFVGVTSAAAAAAIAVAIYDIWFSEDKDDQKAQLTPGPGIGLGLMRSF